MGSKDLFFEVEQCYNAPLTTGQINELEMRKMRHVSTGEYPAPNQNATILPAPIALPERENKIYCLVIWKHENQNETIVFIIQGRVNPPKNRYPAEHERQKALESLRANNPNTEYELGVCYVTKSELQFINAQLKSKSSVDIGSDKAHKIINFSLSPTQKLIMQGKICPYCKKQTEYTEAAYGMIYLCKPCDAYCGVHKGTNKSLGRLAKADLRQQRQEAHKYFDAIWLQGQVDRKQLYCELAEYLEIPFKYCHIAMFSIATCQKVVVWAKKKLNYLQQLI
jgi:hypothetical protein